MYLSASTLRWTPSTEADLREAVIAGVEERDGVLPTLEPVPVRPGCPPLAASCQIIPADADPALVRVVVSVGASGTASYTFEGAYFGRGEKRPAEFRRASESSANFAAHQKNG